MKKILAAALALWMTMGAAALAEGTFRVGVKQDVYGFGGDGRVLRHGD